MSSGHGDIKFVCNLLENASMTKALEELTIFQAKSHEEKKFVEQRLNALKKEKQAKWRALWDAAKEEGFIDPLLNYDEYNMSLGDARKQLFIEKCDCHKGGGMHLDGIELISSSSGSFKDLLSTLFGKNTD